MNGYTLVEVLIVMAIVLLVMGAMSTMMIQSARVTTVLLRTMQDTADGWSRIARQTTNLDVPIEGVTIERDAGRPENSTCQMYRLTTTTTAGVTLEQFVTRRCVVQ